MELDRHLDRLYYLDNYFNNLMEMAAQGHGWKLINYIWENHARPNDRAILVAEYYQTLLLRE